MSAALLALLVAAQTPPVAAPADPPPAAPPADPEIVVRGQRSFGSAVGAVEPVAVLGGDALRALGATTTADLVARLKGVATSGAGGDPAVLLNGHRVSGNQELYSLPFEAIDRTEILSEQDAARFGYPPTVRVMNFITKKHFRGLEALAIPSTATEGGGTTGFVQANATRIDEGRRLTLGASYQHAARILQSQRRLAPDPAVPFAIPGNVVGAGGGSIDPALDAVAGRAVAIAGVPADPAARTRLAAYAASPAIVTDIGPYRTLQPMSDRLHMDAAWARPLGKLDLSLDASAQGDWSEGLNGLAAGAIAVPAGSPALAFSTPVEVDRYFPGAVLAQHAASSALHGGATVRGGLGHWSWSVTGHYERTDNRVASDTGVPVDALQAAVSAGGDPLQPLDAASAAARTVQRSAARTDTYGGKGVANGSLVRLPAGDALVTLTTQYDRSASRTGPGGFARAVTGASAGIDVPIANAARGVLPFAGRLGVNALVGVTGVSGYGRLATANVGFDWAPAAFVQLSGSINETRSAPAINLLADPVLVTPNVPVFDYTSGTSVLVATTGGGNPALAPERRRVSTLTLALKPFKAKDIRLTLDLVDTSIQNQSASLANVTQPFQAAFPELFARGATGALVGVDLRPVNLARERERKVHWALGGSSTIGRTPPPPPPPAPNAPPPPPPRPQLNVYAFLSGNYRLSDRLTLRDGAGDLDLLDGASLTGSGGRPRWDVEGTIGAGYGPVNAGIFTQMQGPTRVRSTLASADLHFSGRTFLVSFFDLELERVTHAKWAKRLSANLIVDNLLNERIDVRDRDGLVPNRFQGAYLDPVGRTVRLGLRKVF